MTVFLTIEEETKLANRWREHGDQAAFDRLVNSQLSLVFRIAKCYKGHNETAWEDLVSEGRVGLLVAVCKFDPSKARLITHATWWIRAYVLDYRLRSHGPLRIGTTRAHRKIFFQYGKARRRLEAEGITPTPEKLAERLKVSLEDILFMMPRIAPRADLALDAPLPEDSQQVGRGFAGEGVLSDDALTPEERAEASEETRQRKAVLAKALDELNAREQEIIRERHLCDEEDVKPLHALGTRYGVSRQRVQQIEAQALAKLKVSLDKHGYTGGCP